LRPGSRLVAVAPGTWWESPQQEAERLRLRCAAEGWTLVIPPEATGRWRWFSGPDASRRTQLERAWADPTLDAVLCVAGGWGSARILEAGWKPGERPVWLVGFSDATALLLAQWAAGLGGAVHASCGGDEAQWQRLVRLLRGESLPSLVGTGWVRGVASGPLVVANLTVATSLIGTPWFPQLKGCVLVIEDVGEAPYRVDRMLTQWRTAGLLSELAGMGVGRFSWKEDDVLPGDLSLEEVLQDRLGDLGIPVVGQLPVGHGRPNLALPLGRIGVIDGDAGHLSVV
jgi:muramoyltetrapeptide carboxypeptidase